MPMVMPNGTTVDEWRRLTGESLIWNRPPVFWMHLLHAAALAAISMVLLRRCAICMRSLRVFELLTFGLTALFFMSVQHDATVVVAEKHGYLFDPAGLWFLLMFTYAMFIPNTWQRASVVLGFIAAAPVVCMIVDAATHESVRVALFHDHSEIAGLVLSMCVGYGTAVYGTYIIGSLRREAYVARQMGQYKLRHLIGSGGMGEVYLAEHILLKRPCAIKLIRRGKAADPLALARFELEVRATSTLTHWNTVEIFDYGNTEDGTFYYVMEYLKGMSVAELVDRRGPLAPEHAIHLLMQVCDALREAHSVGLIHRDVKPGNVFSAQLGGVYDVAKLLDFGLAKSLRSDIGLDLTQDGAITGSPLYMSPEQALGEHEPDARSDIYSLGAVAYFMVTGRPPFVESTPMKIIVAHAKEPVVPPSELRRDLPRDLEEIILRCMAKQPVDRYANIMAVREALADCATAGKWTRARAADWWQSPERKPQPAPVA